MSSYDALIEELIDAAEEPQSLSGDALRAGHILIPIYETNEE